MTARLTALLILLACHVQVVGADNTSGQSADYKDAAYERIVASLAEFTIRFNQLGDHSNQHRGIEDILVEAFEKTLRTNPKANTYYEQRQKTARILAKEAWPLSVSAGGEFAGGAKSSMDNVLPPARTSYRDFMASMSAALNLAFQNRITYESDNTSNFDVTRLVDQLSHDHVRARINQRMMVRAAIIDIMYAAGIDLAHDWGLVLDP